LTATGTGPGNNVVAADTASTPDSQWDVNDWMADYSTLRNVGNGKYLTGNFGPFNTASDEPSGWFVQQQFRLEQQDDGTYLIQYVGYETNESWWWIPEHYVTVAADGTVGTGSKADAARFEKEVVVNGVESAVAAATDADAAVVVVGSQPFVYGRENHDRESLELGGSQQALVEAVTAANPNTVVVLETSYPVTMDTEPGSLLWTTHAGSEAGNAIAGAIFGDTNPGGRLTQTWYAGTDDLPSIRDYDIIKNGVTYMYYDGTPLYPFGHGLSYSTFEYSNLKTSGKTVGGDGIVRVSVEVTNTGELPGDEVVQLYTRQRMSRDTAASKQLRAFERVSLEPGETTTVRLAVPTAELAHWDVTRNKWVVESSDYDLLVGSSSADIREQATVRVHGETIPPRNLSKPTRAENFDDYSDILLVDESKERGTAVEAAADGGWVKFADARLGKGATTFTAQVANASSGAGTIEIRLDSPTGPLAGTATVDSTGDVYAYQTTGASLTGTTGTRDVYLVFGGDVRLATFSIN
jgi:beta-glucosidase